MRFLSCLIAVALISACKGPPAKDLLKETIAKNDPAMAKLEVGFNDYVHLTRLKDGTEMGIISLTDGASSKYWFLSHHFTDDAGGTWFEMSDGTKTFMEGAFCCEVQLPDDQLKDLVGLKRFIVEHDESKK